MRNKALRILLHATVWLAVYLLPYSVLYGRISPDAIFGEPGAVVHVVSTALLIAWVYLNYYELVPRFYLNRRYVLYGLLAIAGVIVVIRFPQIFMHPFEQGPPRLGPPPGDGFHPDDHEPFAFSKINYNVLLYIVCTLISINIRQQRQLLEMQQEKLNAELSFLKAQINPHFLFNTLNSIYALAIRKSDDTPRSILQLSELMRYILKDAHADTVPLGRELNYIDNYITLQRRRLGNTVQIEYSAPEKPGSQLVAPLILMSFVENAFKHGVNPDQDSEIRISITLQDNQLNMSVVNNKVSAINRNENMGIGLKNAVSRLEHLYPGKHELTIDDEAQTFSVHLRLQLHD